MQTVLTVPVLDKVYPAFAELRADIEGVASGSWLPDAALRIHLADLDAGEVDANAERVEVALAKATNAHQGFKVQLGNVDFVAGGKGKTHLIVPVQENAGMLQAMTFSFGERVGNRVSLSYEEPWRPLLRVATFDRLADLDRLRMQALVHRIRIEMTIKAMGVYRVAEDGSFQEIHSGKLPASGG